MAGQNLIKKAGAETEYTPENIQELKKCMHDPVHFIRNYVYLQHPKMGKMLFNLYDYQEDLVRNLQAERWVIALLARQMGKTQTISMFLLWYSMFHNDQTILIASKNNAHAMEIMDRIRFAYEELPHWLKAGCNYYNKHSIEFDNGSRIISQSTTEKTGRGYSISKLYLDELAFINPRIQENMWASLAPTLSTGGSAIISSTPNGDTELYAQLWRGANSKKNSFKPVFYPWNLHPERGEDYLKEMEGQLGPKKFRQEVLCEFISSDAMLIDSIKLAYFKSTNPIREDMGFKFWKEVGGRNKTYLVGVDPATGNGNDFTAIQVVEFPGFEQVAELRLNTVHVPLIYSKIKWLLKELRKPDATKGRAEIIWSFERNGVGEALVAMIQNDDAADGGVYLDGCDLYNESNNGRLGCYTTGKSKLVNCMQLKNMVEKIKGGLIINSEELLFELKNFVAAGGSYQARIGCTDDLISGMLVVMKVLNRLSQYDDNARQVVYENVSPDYNPDEMPATDQFDGDIVPFTFL